MKYGRSVAASSSVNRSGAYSMDGGLVPVASAPASARADPATALRSAGDRPPGATSIVVRPVTLAAGPIRRPRRAHAGSARRLDRAGACAGGSGGAARACRSASRARIWRRSRRAELVDLDLGLAVAGVAARHDVECPGGTGRSRPRPWWRGPSNQGRPSSSISSSSAGLDRRKPVGRGAEDAHVHGERAVAELERVERQAPSRAGCSPAPEPDRAGEVAASGYGMKADQRAGRASRRPPRARRHRRATSRSGGRLGRAPPLLAGPDHGDVGHRDDARGGDHPAAARVGRRHGRVAAVSGSGATSAIWRSRSMTA